MAWPDVADAAFANGPELAPEGLEPPLVERAADLACLGFEVEPFGEGTLKVSAVPLLLSTEESAQALLALAEDLEGLDRGAHVQEALRLEALRAP